MFRVFGHCFGEGIDEEVEVDSKVLDGFSLAAFEGVEERALGWRGCLGFRVGQDGLGEDEVGCEAGEEEGVVED